MVSARRSTRRRECHAVLIMLSIVVVACGRRGDRPIEPEPVQIPGQPAPDPGPTFSRPGASARRLEVPPGADTAVTVEVADPEHVDVLEVYPQARALALRLQPEARLVSIIAFQVRRGTVDLTRDGRVSVEFDFKGLDAAKPPGEDKVERKVTVEIKGNRAAARMRPSATRLEDHGFLSGALPDPMCTTKKAWSTAVASGVPDDAVGTMHYYNNRTFSPASPAVWSLRVDGHDELRREIDGRTGALVKRWDGTGRHAATKGTGAPVVDPWAP